MKGISYVQHLERLCLICYDVAVELVGEEEAQRLVGEKVKEDVRDFFCNQESIKPDTAYDFNMAKDASN